MKGRARHMKATPTKLPRPILEMKNRRLCGCAYNTYTGNDMYVVHDTGTRYMYSCWQRVVFDGDYYYLAICFIVCYIEASCRGL
jgi:hypothetical protein